ncbi:hypothetical protein NP233_g12431 [Leucocoprinus birnbaumii]|uniref:Cytochrome P450 n=1 Tax=Leucocoprinus birnbaumii TaxID=56174 RepID=A0AAD5YKF8_9AGAR|nr:hypothetical protein NP233_g12431 [Leucocoprinus birnbaumii]
MSLSLRDALIITVCVVVHLAYRYRNKSKYPLPPGMPKWPIVGNAFQIPASQQHLFFKDLGEQLGSKIFYLKAFSQDMIVINDVKIAQDLLDKRSSLYSSRARTPMLNDLIGINYFFPFMQYGDEWRSHRRIFQQYFSPKNMKKEEERTVDFIRKGLLPNLYETPEKFLEHLLNVVGGLITATTYGVQIHRVNDPLVEYQEHVYGAGEKAATPGQFLVDVIPQLKYVPGWFPGAGFQNVAREIKEMTEEVMDKTYDMTLKGIDDGSTSDCFVSWSLENNSGQANYDSQALRTKQIAAAIYKAGSDTRLASSTTFVMAMLLHPDVQHKAQAELDSVVGHDRLPDFSDRSHLPYINAILKEVLRYNPPLPFGLPHLTSGEDVYDGYYIPKGAMVFANSYAMLQDEETFPNPRSFKPERFMNADGTLRTDILDPESVATFGFGRRICPGAQLALSTLYLMFSSILALYDIMPEQDSAGKPIHVSPEFGGHSIISQPIPFRCKITPRKGKNVEGLLKDYLGHEVI